MATFAFTDASVTINSVDLSDHAISVTADIGAEMLDNTAFGHTARTVGPGLKTGALQVEFLQDFASSKVDATLFPLIGAAAFTVVIIPVNASVTATNPSYTATMVLESYPPMGGSVGDQAKTTATFANAGSAGWARGV